MYASLAAFRFFFHDDQMIPPPSDPIDKKSNKNCKLHKFSVFHECNRVPTTTVAISGPLAYARARSQSYSVNPVDGAYSWLTGSNIINYYYFNNCSYISRSIRFEYSICTIFMF